MFLGPFDESIIKRAKGKKLIDIELVNIRDFGVTKHKMVDDTPYGGGVGMVMRIDVLYPAIEAIKQQFAKQQANNKLVRQLVVLLSASGEKFTQAQAKVFSTVDHLILICGHYEGVDERILEYIDEEVSIGDFVLTGGEIPAMLITDAVIRLLPGVITQGATEHESFSLETDGKQLVEYPQYTKPETYQGVTVPQVLLSGHHENIKKWRLEQAGIKTQKNRPDLLEKKN